MSNKKIEGGIDAAKTNLLQAISAYNRCSDVTMTPGKIETFDNILAAINFLVVVAIKKGRKNGLNEAAEMLSGERRYMLEHNLKQKGG
jgi:hypothetical protein